MPQISPIGDSMRTDSYASGFTIFEVLIALLLIAVVCGIVLPAMYQSKQNTEMKTVIRQVQMDLRQLIDEAKGTGLPGQMIFTPGVPDYQVVTGEQTLDRPLMGYIVSGDESLQVDVLPTGEVQGISELSIVDASGKSYRIAMKPSKGS